MKEANIQIRHKENPVLIDKILQDIQKHLLDKLPWLNYAFGRAYRFVSYMPDGNKNIYPAAYIGKGEYASLLPNDNYGNFSWFDIYDPQVILQSTFPQSLLSFEGAIVFWYNLSSIYEDDTVLYTEEIKSEVLKVLTFPGILTNGRITVKEFSEKFDNIYKDYTVEKIYNKYAYKGEGMQDLDKQFFMYPYAALRVEFSVMQRDSLAIGSSIIPGGGSGSGSGGSGSGPGGTLKFC